MSSLFFYRSHIHFRRLRHGALWVLLILLFFTGRDARAAWFVDPVRFHASAHGQMSCLTCHETIRDQALHPDPRNVGKPLQQGDASKLCLYCHEGIPAALKAGTHGAIQVDDPSTYRRCTGCHSPHYQIRLTDEKEYGVDPKKPIRAQCGTCHAPRTTLPERSEEDQACMTCHRPMMPDEPQEIERINTLCLHCHGQSGIRAQAITGEKVPLIDPETHENTPHADLACVTCHRAAASLVHPQQEPVACGQCHPPHHEEMAHDAHVRVSCRSCHLKGIRAVRDAQTKCIRWQKERFPGEQSFIHEMVRFESETPCQRCHYAGNPLGAAAMVLPPKSILCMPCHTATFTVEDPITIVSLAICCMGLILFFSIFLSGSLTGGRRTSPFRKLVRLLSVAFKVLFSAQIIPIIRTLFWDVLLQRRLYRQSRIRWSIHALIFWAFILRFGWGLLALLGSLLKPEWPVVWDLVNKNNPWTAFWFDITGLILFLGIVFAFIRGARSRSRHTPGLPEQDRLALSLIGGIVIVGFILEGMRIALTGYPNNAVYGFIGYGIAHLFSAPRGLTEVYGFVWYIHAILTGAFIAYIPFSRLLHMIMAPVVLSMNAVSHQHPQGDKTPDG